MMIQAAGFGGGRAPLAIALTSGVITAFNPCGFAMLPAYVSYFVGHTGAEQKPALSKRLVRAALTGGVVTLGFMTVFGAIGLVATQFLSQITAVVPYVSIVVGVVLVILGVAMVRGYEPKLSLPQVKSAKRGSSLSSMYIYGVSYAVVSLSCGFAGFLTTVVTASSEKSWASSMGVYAAFSAGMGLVLIVLSFAVALAQQAFVKGLRKVLPYANGASGALMVAAGLYVAYYGYYEWATVLRGYSAPAGPVDWVQGWSDTILRRVNALSTPTLIIAIAAVSAVVISSVVISRRARTTSYSSGAR